VKGDLHVERRSTWVDHSLSPDSPSSTMHFGPFSASRLEHLPKSRSPSNLDWKVPTTHVGGHALPWVPGHFSIPPCSVCSPCYRFQQCVSCSCPWAGPGSVVTQCQLLSHATDKTPIKRDGWLCPAAADGSKCQPCFAALPFVFFTVSRARASSDCGGQGLGLALAWPQQLSW
jgi:hypothetical protein